LPLSGEVEAAAPEFALGRGVADAAGVEFVPVCGSGEPPKPGSAYRSRDD
jgi:hypothetical protein